MQNAEATGTSTASSSVSELILAAALLESFVSAGIGGVGDGVSDGFEVVAPESILRLAAFVVGVAAEKSPVVPPDDPGRVPPAVLARLERCRERLELFRLDGV